MPNKINQSLPKKKESRTLTHPKSEGWIWQISRFYSHFGRFSRDVLGVTLLAFTFLSLLAVMRLTEGKLLTPWATQLIQWFGWGSYLVIVVVGVVGLFALQRSNIHLSIGRVLAIEMAVFLTFALFSTIGGNSLERADVGLDGGRLGWGLSIFIQSIVGHPWNLVMIIGGWILAVISGFGLWSYVESWLFHAVGITNPENKEMITLTQEHPDPPLELSETRSNNKKKPHLNIGSQKSLRISEEQDRQPPGQSHRDERLPALDILLSEQLSRPDERTINQTAGLIVKTLAEFGIPARVVGYRVGPTVTQFAVEPGFIEKSGNGDEAQRMKVRIGQIASLHRDIALALSAQRLRIEAPVPGRAYVGIEVPNSHSSLVRLRPLLEAEAFFKVASPLAIALGRDVSGQPLVADLVRMPHLLIGGATGSGKSVCITSIAVCLAMNNTPDHLRLVMIDSKMVELIRFNGLRHLYGKVETDIQRIMGVLRWIVLEMERRYRLLEAAHSRDLDSYNQRLVRRKEGMPLPRIVVIIDELADLMMSAPDQTEHTLVRLAQMARATGIHLIVATQRPSTDVITGLIKANFPARISFSMVSGIDSRIILDSGGAETLLGRGDMLFLNPEVGNPIRAQGVIIADHEIERLITYWQTSYVSGDESPPWEKLLSEPTEDEDDALIEQAISIVRKTRRASVSLIQRRLRVGFPRAARLLDQLEEMGIIGPSQGGGREREVLLESDNETEYNEE
jgi:S-DNA-T family DNA segregation ATPase FtsK/SpoIIIE